MGLDISVSIRTERGVCDFRKYNFLLPQFMTDEQIATQEEVCIYKSDIRDFIEKARIVLDDHSKAPELLPTREGFFFGSTDYDDNYFADVKDALDEFENLLDIAETLDDDQEIIFSIWY